MVDYENLNVSDSKKYDWPDSTYIKTSLHENAENNNIKDISLARPIGLFETL